MVRIAAVYYIRSINGDTQIWRHKAIKQHDEEKLKQN